MAELFIVSTPIGHLQDISLRALEVLKHVAYIAAEDTRRAMILLQTFHIQTPVFSLHAHNEKKRLDDVINKLNQGHDVALISDAGTPLISDPGFLLVKKTSECGFRVTPIPGACAAVAALSVSGLPAHAYLFLGFLPHQKQKRLRYMQTLAFETRTLVFYEAVHRIQDTIEMCVQVFGPDRLSCIGRELTKQHETIYRGSLRDVQKQLNCIRGEFVCIVAGHPNPPEYSEQEAYKLLIIFLKELPLSQAVQWTQKITQAPHQKLYQLALMIQKENVLETSNCDTLDATR